MNNYKCCQCGNLFDRETTGTHDFCSNFCSELFQADINTEMTERESSINPNTITRLSQLKTLDSVILKRCKDRVSYQYIDENGNEVALATKKGYGFDSKWYGDWEIRLTASDGGWLSSDVHLNDRYSLNTGCTRPPEPHELDAFFPKLLGTNAITTQPINLDLF